MESYDVVVVGLGGAGSASAFHLARSGVRVLGLERFGPLHAQGSSHGRTRIYRTAYYEGPAYVPLTLRAQVLWRELEAASDAPIIRKTGGLMIGTRESAPVTGALRSAGSHSLTHELLSADQIDDRFPQFRVARGEVAVWEPEAGALFPENCLRAHSLGAVAAGAELHYGEAVRAWSAASGSIEVRTAGAAYRARSLVVTAGSWTSTLVPDLVLPLQIERQFVFWFPSTEPELVRPDRMPVFIWDHGPIGQTYGLPDFGDGVKIGSWGTTVVARPEDTERVVHESDAQPAREFARTRLRGVEPRERAGTTCLYTLTPDRDFVIDRHPRLPNVVIVSACSGHGFKFTSVLGEIVARLVHGEETGYDLAPFRLARFTGAPAQSLSGG